MEQAELTNLIEEAKKGNGIAKNKIVKLIQENGYMKMVSRYLYANRLLEPDDARSEFWIGVVLALPKVKTDVGDPLFYLSWQGVNRVKSQLRKKIGKGVQARCSECEWVGRLYRRNHEYQCPKCGSTNLETHQKEINMSVLIKRSDIDEDHHQFVDLLIHSKPNQLEIDLKLDIEEVKKRLTPQERRVFTLIVEEQIDRDHETNYLLTISHRLGVSGQCVSRYLKKIRMKMERMFPR